MEAISWTLSENQPTDQNDWSDVPPIVQKWMKIRGFKTQAEFEKFESFRLKNITDPFALKDMKKAVDRLIEAFKKNEKICVYADYDMDGTPGLALMISGLKSLGFKNLLSFQPNRFDDGYGVHPPIIENFIKNHDVSLFVTVDVGITDTKAVDLAKQQSVDFIITDHHQPKKDRPRAHAIVNPNQGDCPSGLTHLCGTGVAFYLILALRSSMKDQNLLKTQFDPKKLLDCFAIATLTDMVPLVKENRILIRHGLIQLARTERPGLRLLMKELGLWGRPMNSSDVGLKLAPKLNALGRMNSSVQALELFVVNDPEKARNNVQAILNAQKQRVDIQRKGETFLEKILVDRKPLPFIFEWSEQFHKGIVGLLATYANEHYGVPSFIGSVVGNKILGSARASDQESLLKTLESSSKYLNKFGGHHQAAGFELDLEKANEFKNQLAGFYKKTPHPSQTLHYDFQTTLAEIIDKDFIFWLSRLEPYGTGFSLPVIRMDHLFVSNVRVLKNKHLKMILKDIFGNKINALWFFTDNTDTKKWSSQRISLIGEPSINHYMGKKELQILIKDMKKETL